MSSPLTPGLRGILTIIVDGLLEGTLSRNTNYGTFPYRDSLVCNGHGNADNVLAFLNERVEQLTNGKRSVVYADRKYFSSSPRGGLTFALVPTGEDDSSRNARYFGVAGGSNGVYFAERASDEQIAKMGYRAITSTRQQEQRAAGEAAAARLLAVIRDRVRSMVSQHSSSLTAEQCEDIKAAAGIHSHDTPLSSLFEQIGSLDLRQCFTVLAIIGRAEPPNY